MKEKLNRKIINVKIKFYMLKPTQMLLFRLGKKYYKGIVVKMMLKLLTHTYRKSLLTKGAKYYSRFNMMNVEVYIDKSPLL